MQLLLNQAIDIAKNAGDAIMAIYKTDYAQYQKSDNSPLTEADLAAHHIIIDGLAKMSDLPCISEESGEEDGIGWSQRKNWKKYWLIDPLDGTKEFINKNDEFTVNIALIENGKAILGVVYCPPLKRFYYAAQGLGAFRKDTGQKALAIKVAADPVKNETWKVVGSRHHGSQAMEQFSAQLKNVETLSMGSSLKLCLVAEGAAHLYPRLALTSEWDTAAAQAVVELAGGKVLTANLQPLLYGQKENLLNPFFIVCGQQNSAWSKTFVKLSVET